MSTSENTTVVETVDIDLDNILGIPGAENVMLPEDKKPNVFSKGDVDTTFLDKPAESTNDSDDKSQETPSFTEVLKDINENEPSNIQAATDEDEQKENTW